MAKGKYTGYAWGGSPVWEFDGIYHYMLSKHKTQKKAQEVDVRSDKCHKVIKIDSWYMRFNKLPQSAVNRLKTRR